MKTPFAALTLALALAIAACADTELEVESYTTSCASNADCVVVLTGDVCDCSCNYGTVSAKDQERYQVDFTAKQKNCGSSPPDCGPCSGAKAVCTNKKCSIAGGI
jgi:hypothetical protein